MTTHFRDTLALFAIGSMAILAVFFADADPAALFAFILGR